MLVVVPGLYPANLGVLRFYYLTHQIERPRSRNLPKINFLTHPFPNRPNRRTYTKDTLAMFRTSRQSLARIYLPVSYKGAAIPPCI
jgi:hypothetical protein